jgi:2-keto-4-pentenoate hydratase/2-oxohepta-3-ene-1,7-dioic acid hydratase in catechol pathway/pimeloyl-ACP methyl ester carboxylesterase
MKLATVRHLGRRQVVVVDAEARLAWPIAGMLPASAIGDGSDMIAVVEALAGEAITLRPVGIGIPLDALTLEAPVAAPPKNLLCVGKNYREHAQEFSGSGYDSSTSGAHDAIPKLPIVFTKSANTITAHEAPVPLHPGLDAQVDYEAELAVVIGRGGRGIAKDDALAHVFGYTIANDVTARDLQAAHKQWYLGKSLDGYCPMGPWIVTADEIDAADLALACRVNGELRQQARTRDLIFDIPTLIETISAGITLAPGDIICTGTPAGVGLGFKPPRFLREGDVVEIEIEGIGTLRNRFERASSWVAPRVAAVTAKSPRSLATPRASVPLTFDSAGQGPAVLLVHGLGGTSNSWLPQITALKDSYTVIAADLAGAGRTGGEAPVSITAHVASLAELLERRGIRRAHVIGHSMGSLIAQHLAAAYPNLVASLSLIGPIHEPPEPARKALRDRAAKARSEGMAAIADAIVAGGTSSDTQRHLPAAAAFVRESLMRQSPAGYAFNCEALADAHAIDPTSIRCPVLLVTGDEDRTAPVAAMEAFASRLADARTHVIAGCGHWATVERARQVNTLLQEFLGSLARA